MLFTTRARRGAFSPASLSQLKLTESSLSSITVRTDEIPAEFLEGAQAKRAELVETLAEVDDEIADAWLEEREITPAELSVRPLCLPPLSSLY